MCVLVLQVQALRSQGIDILFDAHTHADVTSSILQLLGMAFSMTLYQQIHRAGKKYDA